MTDHGHYGYYDKAERVDSLGKFLPDYLAELYAYRTERVVILASEHYFEKVWTNVELRAIMSAAIREKEREFIMLVLLDDTELPPLLRDLGRSDRREMSIAEVAKDISDKLRGSVAQASGSLATASLNPRIPGLIVSPQEALAIGADALIPFSIDHDQAEARFRDWVGEQWMAGREFRREVEIRARRSVYLPYWLGRVVFHTAYQGERGIRTGGSGSTSDYQASLTWETVKGTVRHQERDFAVPAFVPEIELGPGADAMLSQIKRGWEVNYRVGVTRGQLSGHGTIGRSLTAEAAAGIYWPSESTLEADIRDDIGGTSQRISGSPRTDLSVLSPELRLVPAWIVDWRDGRTSGRVLINGQTGAAAGEAPRSGWMVLAAVGFVVAVLVGAILCIGSVETDGTGVVGDDSSEGASESAPEDPASPGLD